MVYVDWYQHDLRIVVGSHQYISAEDWEKGGLVGWVNELFGVGLVVLFLVVRLNVGIRGGLYNVEDGR